MGLKMMRKKKKMMMIAMSTDKNTMMVMTTRQREKKVNEMVTSIACTRDKTVKYSYLKEYRSV